ncbi:alpha/beta hydrolase [Actinomadura barringtoniae]|uniref:Alpha/beta hydrolase n=1 Tax=Actinomadura barringtoniae TaxID=1427535 RepID=A0A939T2Y6_9ACTN|nr:alpha/beta hydrolase [Actinomadura barringtoniae]MBO2445914.1 alpha/beta hydrolase [Actinomadura barringtoniae]
MRTHHRSRWALSASAEVDGETLRLYQAQEATSRAPSLVFVHGLEESWDIWSGIGQRLASRFRLLALDLPWRTGNGYAWCRRRSLGDWLGAGLALLDAEPTVIVGHSLGTGAMLEHLHSASGPGPRAIVLASPIYRGEREPVTWATAYRAMDDFREMIGQDLVGRLRPDFDRGDQKLISTMIDKIVDRVGPIGFYSLFLLYAVGGIPDLDRPDIATLVVAGTDDPYATPASLSALTAAVPRSRLVRLRGAGHFAIRDQAPDLAETMITFFDQCLTP